MTSEPKPVFDCALCGGAFWAKEMVHLVDDLVMDASGTGFRRSGYKVSRENRDRAGRLAAKLGFEVQLEDLGPHYWMVVTRHASTGMRFVQ